MARSTWIAGAVVAAAIVIAGAVAMASVALLLDTDKKRSSVPVVASIRGSGSTTQMGAMDAWRAEFQRVHPGLRVAYEANGSGAGIRDFIAGRSAFAGSDVPMSPQEQVRADRRCRGRAMHLPMVVAPIALAYNLPSVPDLKLSPTTVTGIFSGRITRWDAPQIAADNRGSRLPRTGIHVFHRSDDSGTTHNFLSFLKAAGRWPHQPSMTWTGSGQGVVGTSGITQAVQHTRGAIGYVEYGSASNARLKVAKIRNAAGQFVALSQESASKALEGARSVGSKEDLIVRLDHLSKAAGSYPLILVTYEIVCANNSDPLVFSFLNYTASDAGQSYLALYGYAPLPHDLLAKVRTQLGAMT
ncbi:phosphate ABC transporter substrate-binding protein PstS [Nonomuraea sp. MTCD27]|uniref:phosphate ABC transporter substrate-binding protein PstS n=1 Tax=Nonomuraea sp. MTCD27 TaxID=1676747 RepID=UPI0035BFA8DA